MTVSSLLSFFFHVVGAVVLDEDKAKERKKKTLRAPLPWFWSVPRKGKTVLILITPQHCYSIAFAQDFAWSIDRSNNKKRLTTVEEEEKKTRAENSSDNTPPRLENACWAREEYGFEKRKEKKKRSHRSTKHTLALFFFSFFTSVEKEDEKPKAVFMYIWNCIYEQALKTVNMFKKKKKAF